MSAGWQLVVTVSVVTMLCKASGIVLRNVVRGEPLARTRAIMDSLPTATFAALLARELFTHNHVVAVDGRIIGVATALFVTSRGGSPAVAIPMAMISTAIIRNFI